MLFSHHYLISITFPIAIHFSLLLSRILSLVEPLESHPACRRSGVFTDAALGDASLRDTLRRNRVEEEKRTEDGRQVRTTPRTACMHAGRGEGGREGRGC